MSLPFLAHTVAVESDPRRMSVVPSDGLASRLRSLRARLEPIGDLVHGRPGLSDSWRDLAEAIEQAATELEAPHGRSCDSHAA